MYKAAEPNTKTQTYKTIDWFHASDILGMYIAAEPATDNFVAVLRGAQEDVIPGTALVIIVIVIIIIIIIIIIWAQGDVIPGTALVVIIILITTTIMINKILTLGEGAK